MRRSLLTLLSATLVAAAVAGGAARPLVRTTLRGSCAVKNSFDANGVVTSSTLTCEASGTCACAGGGRLLYRATSVSPGNGGPGREQATLSVRGSEGSVTLSLRGTRSGVGFSTGTWTLGNASRLGTITLLRRGTYTMQTTTLQELSGTDAAAVRISAAIGCWACPVGS